MRIATGMSLCLTENGTGCSMTPEHKQTGHLCNVRNQVAVICPRVSLDEDSDLHECLDKSELSSNRRLRSLSVEDKNSSASFHFGANEWLAFWFFLVTSSYLLLRKNVNFFGGCRIQPAEEVSLSNRIARAEDDATAVNDMFSCSESSGSSHRTSSKNSWTGFCTKCDASSEISDLDRESYWHSLLSLEDEDSEWLSDSKPHECSSENPSTPLSYKCDSFTDISDVDTPSNWESLLRLEGKDSEWISNSSTLAKCDAYSEISDLDRASHWQSLLSLEEEDSEWLSDSKAYGCSPENPSTPLSYKCDSFTEISDVDTLSNWDSMLKLEGKDSEWISNPFTLAKCDAHSEISDLDRASYWNSLLSLEEDEEWLSDSKPYECSSENPSSPLSYKCDSFSEISDVDTPSYWDSLLRLEGKDSEWISDSKQELEYVQDGSLSPSYKGSWGIEVLPSVSTISSFTGAHYDKLEDNISAEHLLETADMEEFSADEPLFWPFEGKFNWNSEEPWTSFCTSPRKKGCKQKGDKALCSVNSETSRLSMWSKSSPKIATLECKDEKVAMKRGGVQSYKLLSLSKTFLNEDFDSNKDLPLGREYFALDQELPIETLVGLKEFDGHEGLDSEFNGDDFMLVESLQ
ncbi:hypothetical protein SESBI_11628 [Sesbania bispinosa]|nr:hypothetical protein SESBI_11628 [Sesbania bispinosa]